MTASSVPVNANGNLCVGILARADVVSNAADSIISIDATNDFQFDANNASGFLGEVTNGVGSNPEYGTDDVGNITFWWIEFNYTAGTITLFRNGTQVDQATDYTGDKLSASQTLITMADSAVGQFLDGSHGRIIVTDNMTDELRQKATAAVMWEAGLQGNLPADDPYKNTPPRTW